MTEIINREFPVDPSQLLPAVTPDNEPFWNALARGELVVQSCDHCNTPRYPIVPVCPYCQGTATSWKKLSGDGTVFSYVRYHRSYLPEFADLMPYAVATVQLQSGPRMFGRLIGAEPRIGSAVRMVIERWPNGRCVPAFELVP